MASGTNPLFGGPPYGDSRRGGHYGDYGSYGNPLEAEPYEDEEFTGNDMEDTYGLGPLGAGADLSDSVPGLRLGPGAAGWAGDFLSPHRTANDSPVVVRRSRRRTRGISAFWENGRAVIAMPARLSRAEETHWVERMLVRLEQAERNPPRRRGRNAPAGDDQLFDRAKALSQRYLGGRAVPVSVRWVTNQNTRWGSATPATKTLRISHHVRGMPDWVVDYVLLHELAHLLVASHGPDFWAQLAGYPHLERAKAFLDGASFAATRGIAGNEKETGTDPAGG